MRRVPAGLLFVFSAMIVLGEEAAAQGLVRYVATYGNDFNPCTRSLPCRTLQRGVYAAPSGGQVQILDSGEFTAENTYADGVGIDKSITISAIGVRASLTSREQFDGGIGIRGENTRVVLRGLHVNGDGVGYEGISISNAASVHIEDCTIEGFTQDGIHGSYPYTELLISDAVLRENGLNGIDWGPGPLMVSHSRFERNGGSGLSIAYTFRSTITRSAFTGNGYHGIRLNGGRLSVEWVTATDNGRVANNGAGISNYGAPLTVEHFVARGNDIGLLLGEASSGTITVLSNSVITNNGVGIDNDGYTYTRGNNMIRGNVTDRQGRAIGPVQGL